MKKTFVSVLLAVAMVLASSSSVFAAEAPAALAEYDFSGGIPSGMDVVGGSLSEDAERGQVLTLAGGSTGSSYASVDFSLFQDNDFTQGMTIAMWVKADEGIPGSAPLYSFDIADTGYIATVATLEPAINTTANTDTGYKLVWVDPAKVNDSPEQAVSAEEWHHVAATLSADGMVIYLDGEVFSEPALGFSSANYAAFLEQLQYITGLKLGSWDCSWWQYGDFAGELDDVSVYNSTLTQDQVKAVMTANATTEAAAPSETAASTDVAKTGVVSFALLYGLSAAALGTGSVVLKKKISK